MKIVTAIARYLLALLFLVFGLNGFLHFLPMSMPPGLAGQFVGAMAASHYMVLVFLLQIVGGALLLINRFVPLALVLLGPIIVNIILFHSTMAPEGLAPGLLALVLWAIIFYSVRGAFSSIFVARFPEG